MGVMTVSEFQAEIEGIINRPGLDAARVRRWLTHAIWEFGYALKFRDLEASGIIQFAVGELSKPVPTDFRMAHEEGAYIQVENGLDRVQQLLLETRSNYLRRTGEDTDTSTYSLPRYHHLYGRKIYVRPIPEASHKVLLHYWKKIPAFAANDDVSPLPEEWDEVILTGGASRGFRAYGEYDRFVNLRNDYLGLIRSKAMEDDVEPFPVGGIELTTSEGDFVSGTGRSVSEDE